MKCQIIISGQPNGNSTIARAIPSDNAAERISFGNIRITFGTVKQATRALRSAYKSLINDEPGFKQSITIDKSSKYLSYDASKAIVVGL